MGSLTFETADQQMRTDQLGLRQGFKPGAVNLKAKALAYVNHSRWLADCPRGCGGAREINPDHVYWCVECGQTAIVEWPDKKVMRDITTVLEQRDRQNQNWHPTDHVRSHPANSPFHEPCPDPVTYLAYENDLRGLPVGNDILKRRYEKWLGADWKKRGLAKEMAGFNVESK